MGKMYIVPSRLKYMNNITAITSLEYFLHSEVFKTCTGHIRLLMKLMLLLIYFIYNTLSRTENMLKKEALESRRDLLISIVDHRLHIQLIRDTHNV